MAAAEIMYTPDSAGKFVTSCRGHNVQIRKYHMTTEEMVETKNRWLKEIKDIPSSIRKLAHPTFFNPFRKGIYYAQLQALYLLGSNQWHELSTILPKVQEIMETIIVSYKDESGHHSRATAWNRYKGKSPKSDSKRNKDLLGKMQENFVFMQRLTRLHPCGYKMRQVAASIDYKRETDPGLPRGRWFYRLSTYSTVEEAFPIRDYIDFDLTKKEKMHVTHRFIGKIITKSKIISQGIEQEGAKCQKT